MEDEIAIAEDEHLSAFHAAMHTTRHLQDLVRAQVRLRQHVSPTFDHIGETGVIDDDSVQSLHVQRALPGGGHRQDVRLRRAVLEKRSDHPDWLPAVIESGMNAREPLADQRGGLLDAGTYWQEYADASLLPHDLLQEPVAQEPVGRFVHHFHFRGTVRIERERA